MEPIEPVITKYLVSIEAETAVLGAMMLSKTACDEAISVLTPNMFWREAHSIIFDAISKTLNDDGADYRLVKHQLGTRIKDVGGEDYLIHLADTCCPSPANCLYYADIVKSCYVRREIHKRCLQIAQAAEGPDHTNDSLMGDVAAIGNMDGAVKVPFNHFKDISVIGEDKGVTTGFPELDERITTKGYPSGQMTIIEGYHKSGKSTLMISSYLRMAESGLKVLYATFSDLSAQQIKRRMLRSLCGFVDRPRSDYLAQQFDYACRQIEDVWDVWVYDASDLDTGNDIETFCAWFKAKHSKIGFDAVFMDYAQEIQTRKKTHNEEERQREIATQIRVLASKTGVAAIVGSQVTPGQGTNKTISKGSRAWEEKAGWVLLISEDRTNIGLEWSRFGGDRCKIPICWNSRYLRFESMTEEPQNEL